MVVLVPRQLRFTGITGNVPYYGGRLTPGQAYAASQSSTPTPSASPPTPPASRPAPPQRDPLEALAQLREAGLIDDEEYEQLRGRIAR